MCGILGEFSATNNLIGKQDFIKLNNLNYHRGPDMEGYWTNGKNCQLGFRRLSILDLSKEGNQPLQSNNNRFSMVFNGEIYNYLDIKQDLLSKNIKFNSTSDSEVLVNAFQVYGIKKTLDKIDGMYAIALYDREDDSISLIRDFAGIKPLFYGVKDGTIIFGSRYDQVTKHTKFINNNVNEKVLHTYLQAHYLPSPYGILEDTYQVEPGQIVKFNEKSQLTKSFFWRLPKVNLEESITNKEQAEGTIITALDDAVKSELVADVPVGTFLSGGIDSPLITYFANKNSPNIKSYTIGSDSKVFDESAKAKEYANLIGVNHFLESMNSQMASTILENCMEHLQEPFADFSLIPTYFVSKIAKDNGSTVVLSGDGADELFYGYKRYESLLKNIPFNFIPKSLRYPFYGMDKLLFKNKHINSNFLKQSFSSAHRSMHSRMNKKDIANIFQTENIHTLPLKAYNYKDSSDSVDILLNMQQAEFYDMMQKTLIKVDRMSMAQSIEVRVPFLKKSFINNALKIHPSLSYKDKKTKLILKDVLRQVVPNAPIDKVKKGFSIPLSDWLREELKEVFEDTLFSKTFITKFNISEKSLQNVWDEHQKNIRDRKWVLFTLYSLAKWQENLKK